MTRFDAMYPQCGQDCTQCKMICRRGDAIDSGYAGRLAFLLECMLVDPNGHWSEAADLLDEYKAEWEKVNPSPPTFMGEPMPPERTAIRAEIERLEKVEQEPPMQVVGHGRENGAQYLDITLRGIAVSHIREKALEEAAQAVLAGCGHSWEEIAAAIRGMKGKA